MLSKTALIFAALLAVLSGVSASRNLYAEIVKQSPAFAELVTAAGMKAELSNSNFNGTFLIPVDNFNSKFIKKYSAALKNDQKGLKKIVQQHMLPDTYLHKMVRRARVVDTALVGEQVELYRSPYAGHSMKVFHGDDIGNRGKDAVDVSRILKREQPAARQADDDSQDSGDENGEVFTGAYTANIDNIINPITASLIPKLPAQRLCPVFSATFGKCDLLGAVEGAMAAAGGKLSTCNSPSAAGNQILPAVAFTPFSNALADARPLPAAFSMSQVAPEGASYYWLYRMLQNLESWSVCNAANPGSVFQAPSGWEVISTVPLLQGKALPPSIQFMAILLNRATSDLVILNRGTMSGFEWSVDFSYNQTTAILPEYFSTPIHQGFANVLSVMWNSPGGVAATLQDLVVSQKAVKSITVSGHSLGAGVSTLMSYAVQGFLANNGINDIVVGAGLFAPPNVGPPQFAQDFNAKVNGRRVAWQTDVVTEVPCDPQMFTCRKVLNGFPIPTDQPGRVNNWAYSEVGGTVLLTPDGMPFDQATWASIVNLPLGANAIPFLISTHVCSYLCYFSQYSGNANGEWCWLSQQPPSAGGTQCTGFPWKNGYPTVDDN